MLTIALAAALAASLVTLAAAWRIPGDNRGYEPLQPLAFSHRQHAGDLEISCRYCHAGAERSRYAGVPSPSLCMNCHEQITAPMADVERELELAQQENRPTRTIVSPELGKLYQALALDEELEAIPDGTPKPIAWVQVHNLPDFVYFDHRAHTTAGVRCATCHGPVASMERVRQVESLSMGWCVNCHREANRTGINGRPVAASIDCSTCHY